MLELYQGVAMWLAIWFFFWWLYVYLLRVDRLRHHLATAVYFLFAAAIIIYLFAGYYLPLVAKFDRLPFYLLVFTLVASVIIYHALRRVRGGQEEFVAHHPHTDFLAMNDRFLISKSAEIVFQQTLIVLLVLILRDAGLGLNGIRLMFAIVFVSGHLPLLAVDGWEVGSFFITAAAFASVFFPALILNVNYGFIYSFALHYSFYVLSATIFWLLWGNHKK